MWMNIVMACIFLTSDFGPKFEPKTSRYETWVLQFDCDIQQFQLEVWNISWLHVSPFSGGTAVRRRNARVLNADNKCREWTRITFSRLPEAWGRTHIISNTMTYKIRSFVNEDSYYSGLEYDTALQSGGLVLMFPRNTLPAHLFKPSKWRQYVPLKLWHPPTRLQYGVIFQKTTRSIGLWWYINTTITVLDIIQHPVFYLKINSNL
jgi:hypothetical protein